MPERAVARRVQLQIDPTWYLGPSTTPGTRRLRGVGRWRRADLPMIARAVPCRVVGGLLLRTGSSFNGQHFIIIFRGRDSQCHPSNTQAVYLDVHIAFLCTRLDHGCDRGFLGSWLDLRTGPLPQKTDSEGRALQKPAARGTFPGS